MVRFLGRKMVAIGEWLYFEFLVGYNETALMFTILLLISSQSTLILTAPSLTGLLINILFFMAVRIGVRIRLDAELGLLIASIYSLLSWALV
jgi:hypothetical protein